MLRAEETAAAFCAVLKSRRSPMTNPSSDVLERFAKPAPIIELTPEVVENLQRLLGEVQRHAGLTGLPWRRGAAGGKPLLYGGEEGRGALTAYGTIGSWNEIDLAVAAVNALPALLATIERLSAEMERVKRDLEPFIPQREAWMDSFTDCSDLGISRAGRTYGDLRRAWAALTTVDNSAAGDGE